MPGFLLRENINSRIRQIYSVAGNPLFATVSNG